MGRVVNPHCVNMYTVNYSVFVSPIIPGRKRIPGSGSLRGFIFTLLVAMLSMTAWGGTHVAETTTAGYAEFSNEKALAYSQSVIGEAVGNYQLLDENGEAVDLGSYFNRPLVISMIYTSCHHTCPVLTSNLHNAVKIAQKALGEDSFSVISIGFDAGVDTPERMKSFSAERGIADRHWDFLSADKDTIEQLSRDLGFIFFPSSKGFDHLAQTTILDDRGHVYRQIYGATFQPPTLVEPLKELKYGNRSSIPLSISDWINNIRLFCTIYDPSTGRYSFDYSIFIALVTGVLSLGALLAFLVHLWRSNRTA